jgi:hypothetical protein
MTGYERSITRHTNHGFDGGGGAGFAGGACPPGRSMMRCDRVENPFGRPAGRFGLAERKQIEIGDSSFHDDKLVQEEDGQ